MGATYTFDIFTSLDGFGSYEEPGDWGGYWGKQGPELLDHRARQFADPHRMVFGAKTFREFVAMTAAADEDSEFFDPWVQSMRNMPTTVVSSTITDTSGWPDATVASGDGVEIVRQLKDESDVPLRSHGSLSLNRSLLAAGLVDRIVVSVFPVLTGRYGSAPVFGGVEGIDLELLDSTVLDGRTLELVYHPELHRLTDTIFPTR
ncbi:dihydrofolate reductase family protein [Gordonia sp. C13]|uniref:dihydrofolate reductase family protein n=1 Tax=Gordonia sp. C13 TaxID=2935078 RepID=UPI002009F1CA|nr:dihydrofolate reductase family protein [Gordonia sp. C13]MCK8616085.1 dihydrofolate reductase family protein [Gordonia sp. C13]